MDSHEGELSLEGIAVKLDPVVFHAGTKDTDSPISYPAPTQRPEMRFDSPVANGVIGIVAREE